MRILMTLLIFFIAAVSIVGCEASPQSVATRSAHDPTAPEATEDGELRSLIATKATSWSNPDRVQVHARSYLETTVEPCTVLDAADLDPCDPQGTRHSDITYGFVAVEKERITLPKAKSLEEEMISRSMNADGFLATHVPHFVVRGAFVPDSTRCDFTHLNVSISSAIAEEEIGGIPPKLAEFPWVVTCVTDFSVREYIVGRGPENLTLVTEAVAAALVVRDYTSRLEEDLTDDLAESRIVENTAATREGFEAILWIAPPSNLAVKAWDITGRWDVLRDGEDVKAVHHSLKWFVDTPENRANLIFMLDDFRREMKRAHSKLAELHEGRIGQHEGLAQLMTDANDEFFEAHITAEGAYENVDIVVPAAILLPADE